jgi:hypothetical protein
MATSDPPALTVGDVIRRGGWHPLHARVRALVSVGSEAVSVTDGNGDKVELEVEVEQWAYQDAEWRPAGSTGDRFTRAAPRCCSVLATTSRPPSGTTEATTPCRTAPPR